MQEGLLDEFKLNIASLQQLSGAIQQRGVFLPITVFVLKELPLGEIVRIVMMICCKVWL